jgi:quinolinate synthase
MISYVAERRPKRVVLLTECSMSDNVAVEYPDVSFVRPCGLCPHMKRITLAKIRRALETEIVEVDVDALSAERARASLEGVLKVGPRPRRRSGATSFSRTCSKTSGN